MSKRTSDANTLRHLADRVESGKSKMIGFSIPIYRKDNIVRIELNYGIPDTFPAITPRGLTKGNKCK